MSQDVSEWWRYQGEIDRYFQHEPAVQGLGFEGGSHRNPWEHMHSYDDSFELMTTVFRRLRAADEVMPFRGARYARKAPALGETGATHRQVATTQPRPSASQVLRARYGTRAVDFDHRAPDGAQLLREAQAAYCEAAQQVPALKRRPKAEAHAKMVEVEKERLRKDMAEAVRRLVKGSNHDDGR